MCTVGYIYNTHAHTHAKRCANHPIIGEIYVQPSEKKTYMSDKFADGYTCICPIWGWHIIGHVYCGLYITHTREKVRQPPYNHTRNHTHTHTHSKYTYICLVFVQILYSYETIPIHSNRVSLHVQSLFQYYL